MAMLKTQAFNAFYDHGRFVARVDRHPTSAAIGRDYNISDLNRFCAQRIMCYDHAVAQLHELRIAYALARDHLRGMGAWPPDVGGEGGKTTVVIKGRPDVVFPEAWLPARSLGRLTKALGQPLHRKRGVSRPDGRVLRCLGHTGPWHGGWGDIAWATDLRGYEALLEPLPRIREVLSDEAVAGPWLRPLEAARRQRAYHAEQIFGELLHRAGFDELQTGWFAALAKARIVRHANGTVGIDKWHCYRDEAWAASDSFFSAKGLSKHPNPVVLPDL